jgi:hypothetical protein
MREQRRRERLDKELRETRQALEKRGVEAEQASTDVEVSMMRVKEQAFALKDAKATVERYVRDYEVLSGRCSKLTEDYEEAMKKNQALHLGTNRMEKDAKVAREEFARLNTDKNTMERKMEREHKEKIEVQSRLDDTKAPIAALQAQVVLLEKDLDVFRREELRLQQEKDAVGRQKELQEKQTQKALSLAKDNSDQAKEQERIAYSLESEVDALKKETKEQRALIYQVEKERERYGVEAAEQRNLYLAAMEEVKQRDVQVAELIKKVVEWEKKLKAQQLLNEQVKIVIVIVCCMNTLLCLFIVCSLRCVPSPSCTLPLFFTIHPTACLSLLTFIPIIFSADSKSTPRTRPPPFFASFFSSHFFCSLFQQLTLRSGPSAMSPPSIWWRRRTKSPS